jgi:hypothetical protein
MLEISELASVMVGGMILGNNQHWDNQFSKNKNFFEMYELLMQQN